MRSVLARVVFGTLGGFLLGLAGIALATDQVEARLAERLHAFEVEISEITARLF